MFDFLLTHNHTENPTAIGILITVMSSFFLASLIALTYNWTTSSVQRSNNLLQAMVLIAIVAAMVMQAIGDSLARGLGMLGALAIIRFRTKLDNPRNMAFVFAALANGIACGVYGFTIAYVGTICFCLVAIVLKFSALGSKDILVGTLKFQSPADNNVSQEVEKLLAKTCKKYKLKSERFLNVRRTKAVKNEEGQVVGRMNVDIMKESFYDLSVTDGSKAQNIAQGLEQIEGLSDVRLKFGETGLTL